MPRWEHGSEERLKQAALELFEEQGFENTSAVQIAQRARVTTRTFFRYFPDKQEILFADAETLQTALVQEIRRADGAAGPFQLVLRSLTAFPWGSLGSRESQRRRDAMIAANPQLRERDLIKQEQMADGFSRALHERGADPETAELAARVGVQVFRTAYRQWISAADAADLTTMTDAATSLLAEIMPNA